MPRPASRRETTTIRDAALRLLCAVAHYEDRDLKRGPDNVFAEPVPGRRMVSVGYGYAEIERRLKERFPGCRVSNNSLRWYCAHVREGLLDFYVGWALPYRRPRRPLTPAQRRARLRRFRATRAARRNGRGGPR